MDFLSLLSEYSVEILFIALGFAFLVFIVSLAFDVDVENKGDSTGAGSVSVTAARMNNDFGGDCGGE